MKYRKKPVVVEAFKWTGELKSIEFPVKDAYAGGTQLFIKTLEGLMTADAGDWIIKGIKGEFYPCKPDIFEATYEKVEE